MTALSTTRAFVRAMRPKQWLKNLLVFAAPLSAGVLLDVDVILLALFAFFVFSIASSGVYMLNDLLDLEADQHHPVKRYRPVASGELPVVVAWPSAVVLLLVAVALPIGAGRLEFAIVIATYEVIQILYCVWLKHAVVIDVVVVSSGFLIRAIAGAAILSIPVSQWFLLVASFGSLFMVAGKRYSEKLNHTDDAHVTRRSLVGYSLGYLRFLWSISAALALISYALWAFELDGRNSSVIAAISIVPFGTALLRYALSIDAGRAGAPEDTVLGDRQLLALGVVWLSVFALSVLVGQA